MKGRDKDERKSVDTKKKKIKGKPSWVEGAAVGPGPSARFCPLHLVGQEVERVGSVKLSEHHEKNKYQKTKNEDFSLSETYVVPPAQ